MGGAETLPKTSIVAALSVPVWPFSSSATFKIHTPGEASPQLKTQQFLQQVAWGELDVLILDLPPGTGDIQLTLVQTVALDGALIVTTPQEVALIDARKAVSMFAKVNVPILGLIENMSWFECDHGERYHLFGQGGAQRECERIKVPLLGQIPLEPVIGQRCDGGEPVATLSPSDSKSSAAFHQAAESLLKHVRGE